MIKVVVIVEVVGVSEVEVVGEGEVEFVVEVVFEFVVVTAFVVEGVVASTVGEVNVVEVLDVEGIEVGVFFEAIATIATKSKIPKAPAIKIFCFLLKLQSLPNIESRTEWS